MQAFRLQEYLVAGPIGKAHHLVLDGWAIAGPGAFDLPGIHGRTVQVGADQIVAGRRGFGNMAIDLRGGYLVAHKGKWVRRHIAFLHLQIGPMDRAAVQARRRPGFQAAHGQA